jgi:hypothetical protein
VTAFSFRTMMGKIPSSLLAFYAVHGGQSIFFDQDKFWNGLFGSYVCVIDQYSMHIIQIQDNRDSYINYSGGPPGLPVGYSPGSARMILYVNPTAEDPEGQILIRRNQCPMEPSYLVGHGGILSYFETYVERLEAGVYPPESIFKHNQHPARGINLFPATGKAVRCSVSNGIEIRASARWFPSRDPRLGLVFGYCIRIRTVADDDDRPYESTCQVVGRSVSTTKNQE